MIMIMKLGDWRIHTDRVISSENILVLESLKKLQQRLEQDIHRIALERGETRLRLAHKLKRSRHRCAEKGYQQGFAKGLATATQAFAVHVLAWKSLEHSVTKAAMESISAVLGFLPDELLVTAQIRKAFLAAGERTVLRIHADPVSAIEVEKVLQELSEQIGARVCELTVDSSLAEGSCLVETDSGIVDGSIGCQIEAIRNGVHAALADICAIDLPGGSNEFSNVPGLG